MPILLYNLELTENELQALWVRFVLLGGHNKLDSPDEVSILDKVERLMEGR